MKKCSSSLFIREMQIRTTLKCHLMPVRMAIIKKSGVNRCWRRCGEIGTLLHYGGSVNQFNHCGRQCGDASRTQKQKFHLTQQFSYWVYIQRIINCFIIAHMHTNVHCSTVYNSKDLEPTQMPIDVDRENVAHIHHGTLCSHKKR